MHPYDARRTNENRRRGIAMYTIAPALSVLPIVCQYRSKDKYEVLDANSPVDPLQRAIFKFRR